MHARARALPSNAKNVYFLRTLISVRMRNTRGDQMRRLVEALGVECLASTCTFMHSKWAPGCGELLDDVVLVAWGSAISVDSARLRCHFGQMKICSRATASQHCASVRVNEGIGCVSSATCMCKISVIRVCLDCMFRRRQV